MGTELAADPPPAGATASAGVTVVLPCLDEEASIGEVIDGARAALAGLDRPYEILVVDNGCSDATASVARDRGARVLVEPVRGYGAALRRGIDAAAHEVVVMGDGDRSYDLGQLERVAEPILRGQADLVIGNRMGGLQRGAMPLSHRYLGNPGLSFVLRLLFRGQVRDAHCGLRAVSRTAYRRLGCVTTGMEFASEMIVRALDLGLRVAECDVTYRPRLGRSKLRPLHDGWRHLRLMLLHGPTRALLWPGVALWTLGLVVCAPLAFGPIVIEGRWIDVHMMMMGGLLNILSVQAITIGLLAKTYAHQSGLRRDPVVAWLLRHLTLERALAVTVPPILLGSGMAAWIVLSWMASGFGDLDESRLLFLAILLLVNGFQLATSAYLLAIMKVPQRP